MMKKVLKVITNNFGFKVLAVVFAIIFWMIVVSVNDPNSTKTFTVAVTMENENVISEMGKVYEVLDDSDVVSFVVTGARSVVDELSANDFTATADLSQIQGMSLVPIEISASKYANRISIEKRDQNVRVSVEDAIENQFAISTDTTGTPADGCAVGKVSVSPNVITISGAESLVSKIAKVVATVNVSNMSGDVTDRVKPVLYDSEGAIINSENLVFSHKKVKITAKIEGVTSLDIDFGSTGEVAEGYYVSELKASPTSISVQGKDSAISGLEKIVIPDNVLDVSKAKENVTVTVDIKDYLPSGAQLVDEDQSRVVLTAVVKAYDTTTFTIDTSKFEFENIPEGMTIEPGQDTVKITLQGEEEAIAALKESDITGRIDCADADAETKRLTIELDELPEGIVLPNEVSIKVVVSLPEEDSEEETETTQDNEE